MNPFDLAQEVANQNELPLGSVSPVYAELEEIAQQMHAAQRGDVRDIEQEAQAVVSRAEMRVQASEYEQRGKDLITEAKALAMVEGTYSMNARVWLEIAEIGADPQALDRAVENINELFTQDNIDNLLKWAGTLAAKAGNQPLAEKCRAKCANEGTRARIDIELAAAAASAGDIPRAFEYIEQLQINSSVPRDMKMQMLARVLESPMDPSQMEYARDEILEPLMSEVSSYYNSTYSSILRALIATGQYQRAVELNQSKSPMLYAEGATIIAQTAQTVEAWWEALDAKEMVDGFYSASNVDLICEGLIRLGQSEQLFARVAQTTSTHEKVGILLALARYDGNRRAYLYVKDILGSLDDHHFLGGEFYEEAISCVSLGVLRYDEKPTRETLDQIKSSDYIDSIHAYCAVAGAYLQRARELRMRADQM